MNLTQIWYDEFTTRMFNHKLSLIAFAKPNPSQKYIFPFMIMLYNVCLKFHIVNMPPLGRVTLYCTHFLKIGFVVAGGGFYSYHIHQGNKSYKQRKIVRKKLSFMPIKRFNTFLKYRCNSVGVQFHVNHCTLVQRGSTSQIFYM